ncbi:MAG TPA: 2-isopropylmalate synthase [Candidatus Lokiarchaeia archaeon]|nr:2-isopropylmalate synthase [Candidatus Lokiarchaeia archaeon]
MTSHLRSKLCSNRAKNQGVKRCNKAILFSDKKDIYVSPHIDLVRSKLPEHVYFFDTTMRDGEQTPEVSFTIDEKLKIAQQFDVLGIDIIEAGMPVVSKGDFEACKQISHLGLNAQVLGLARLSQKDIDSVIDADMNAIHVFIATSDLHLRDKLHMTREQCIESISTWVAYAKSHYDVVEFSAEDATRTDLDFLLQANTTAVEAGATRINIPDTVGTTTPKAYAYIIEKNREILPPEVKICVHCHNDFGLAVANSLAGIESGAEVVHTTFLGIGERAGNASFEQVAASLYALYGAEMSINIKELYKTSKLVERFSNIRIPVQFPLIGKNAFRHESGIHAHAVIQNPRTYEPLTPELIGYPRTDELADIVSQSITIGKHTGSHSLKAKLDELGVSCTEEQFTEIFERLKDLADKRKNIADIDLISIANDVTGHLAQEDKTVILDELTVLTGSVTPTATATIRVRLNGDWEKRVDSSIGVGPVDAAVKSILKTFKEIGNIELLEYEIEAVTGGTEALGVTSVKIRDENGVTVSGHAVHEDIVMSSVQAVLNALNKLMKSRKGNDGHEAETTPERSRPQL